METLHEVLPPALMYINTPAFGMYVALTELGFPIVAVIEVYKCVSACACAAQTFAMIPELLPEIDVLKLAEASSRTFERLRCNVGV